MLKWFIKKNYKWIIHCIIMIVIAFLCYYIIHSELEKEKEGKNYTLNEKHCLKEKGV